MAIQFVLGATGTGKTVHVFNELFELQNQKKNEFQLYLVPEQYTLKAQEEYLLHTKANGLLNIEVLSFNRLVNRFFDDLGIADKKLMSDTSMSMILRKLILQHKDEFVWISNNSKLQSFVEEMSSIIKECYQYNVTTEQLILFSNKIEEQLLKDKLHDFSLLLHYFKAVQQQDYITQEEAALVLCNCIPHNDILKNATIYIDGFYGFTPLQYKIIENLLVTSKKIVFCVTLPLTESMGDMKDETSLYYESKKMISTIREFAQEHRIEEIEPYWLEDYYRSQKKSLQHMTNFLYQFPIVSYDEKETHVRLVEGTTIHDEVEVVAMRIHQLIYDRNYRYKDIVVLTTDLTSYEEDLRIIFDEYEFNFFIDKKETVSNHPIVQFILSALLVNQFNFRYEHIFYHLKSIFYDNQDKIEKIENYCLSHGIKGAKKWETIWQDYEDEKQVFLKNLFCFHHAMNKGKTVRDKIKSVYDFILSSNIRVKGSEIAKDLIDAGKFQDALAYEQIYRLIIDLFDQTIELIGDELIEKAEFAALLETGLSQIKLGQTPVNVDQLLVGQVNRSRFREAKAVFILGANEGKLPLVLTTGSLFTDNEREILQSMGAEFKPTQEKSLFKETMSIYMAMTRCTNLLHVSYARQGYEEALRPAPLVATLMKMFPFIPLENTQKILEESAVLTRSKPLFNRMVRLSTKERLECHEKNINLLYNLCKKVYNYIGCSKMINPVQFFQGLEYHNETNSLVELADGDYQIGVSELETYRNCPYQHFLDFRLKINERKEYLISMPDIGNLYHECLERYLKKCLIRQLDLSDMDSGVRNKLIDETIHELVSDERYFVFSSSFQNKYLIIKLTRILKRAIWGIEQHISRHILRPKEFEYKFSGKTLHIEPLRIYTQQGTHMYLKGVVDRIDEYSTESTVFYSIFDYKSSHNEIDLNLVKQGIQLQLVMYLDVVKSIKEHGSLKQVVPVGLYYYHIHDPYIKIEDEKNDIEKNDIEKIETEINEDILSDNISFNRKLNDEFEDERTKLLSPKGYALNHDYLNELLLRRTSELTEEQRLLVEQSLNKSKSQVLTEDELSITLTHVRETAIKLCENIYLGNIPIKPYRYGQTTSCDYCKYKAICRFDPSNSNESFELVEKKTKDEVISQMKGACNGRSHKENNSN